jgi:hypothetical protein
MKEIHQHGQCLNSAISNGAQSAPQSELQQKDPASQILEEQPEALRGLLRLVGYWDWIDSEENSPRISLKLIRHSFQG